MNQNSEPQRVTQTAGTLIFERFSIRNLIAAGSQAEVYLADDLQLQREVAIKILNLHANADACERLKREAGILSNLTHQNIVRIYSSSALPDGRVCLILEYVKGISLRDYLNSVGKLSYPAFVQIFEQVLSALSYLHANNIVHRDLKPENILLAGIALGADAGLDSGSGKCFEVKLADFGIAKVLDTGTGRQSGTQAQIIGTAAYMSPEQCASKPVDCRSDIYSLACIMYECLAGKPVFQSESPLELIYKHSAEAVPPLNISGELDKFIGKGLEKEADKRFASCEEMRKNMPAAELVKQGSGGVKIRPLLAAFLSITLIALSLFFVASFIVGARKNPLDQSLGIKDEGQLLLEKNANSDSAARIADLKKILELKGENNRKYRLPAYVELIRFLCLKGQAEDAKPLALRFISEADGLSDKTRNYYLGKAKFLYENILLLESDYKKALEFGEQSVALLEKADSTEDQYATLLSACLEAGLVANRAMLFETGRNYSMKAIELLEKPKFGRFDINSWSSAEIELMRSLTGMHKKEQAITILDRMEKRVKEEGSQYTLLNFPKSIAEFSGAPIAVGEFELADKCLASAERMSRDSTGEYKIETDAIRFFELANLDYCKRRKLEHKGFLDESLREFSRLSSPSPSFLLSVAQLYLQANDYEGAARAYRLLASTLPVGETQLFREYGYRAELGLVDLELRKKNYIAALKQADSLLELLKHNKAYDTELMTKAVELRQKALR